MDLAAFAWLKCKKEEDAESLLRGHKMLARGGRRFGTDSTFVRVSMMSSEDVFEVFLERLPGIRGGVRSSSNNV